MKLVSFGPESLGNMTLKKAFDAMFNNDTLLIVHGPSLRTTEWHNNKRIVKFSINIDNVPKEIRRVFCGSKLKITTKQEMHESLKQLHIVNKIRLHFLGAEFIKIKPSFVLQESDGEIFISGNVEHHAILPPPLDKIAEHFMSIQTQRELDSYRDIIKLQLSIELVNLR